MEFIWQDMRYGVRLLLKEFGELSMTIRAN